MKSPRTVKYDLLARRKTFVLNALARQGLTLADTRTMTLDELRALPFIGATKSQMDSRPCAQGRRRVTVQFGTDRRYSLAWRLSNRPPKIICAWCCKTVREGSLPASHGICDACAEALKAAA